jgi:hypothetical protein
MVAWLNLRRGEGYHASVAESGDPLLGDRETKMANDLTQEKWIRRGFLVAGAMNIGGVLLFSRGLSNTVLMQADPVIMGPFGLLMIMVWGLAYIAVADSHRNVPWLVGVFCLEKIAYTAAWMHWLAENASRLGDIFTQDSFAGTFYCIYGANDFAFALFFGAVFLRLRKYA